ncbi:MAG: PorV/PorQ family protein [Ignavibacteriae bacterium]|nr:PorV/PorQ family protein [Ignavibacteriota bacterium]
MKKLLFSILPFFAVSVLATTAFSQKVGSTSMQFLKVMPCARATAMGEAYSVLASGAEAVFWNPAGLALIDNSEVSMTYLNWIFDTQQGALSFATSFESFGNIGVQVQYVDFGEIEEAKWTAPYNQSTEYPGLTGNTFRPFTYLVGVSYANRLTDKFTVGLTAKYAHESLYNGSMAETFDSRKNPVTVKTWANGLMFDFGIGYNTGFRSIRIGAAVQNFGADVKYAGEANPLPLSLRVGIATDVMGHDALFFESEESRLSLAFDLFQPNDYAQQAHMGMEYEFSNLVALRVGYKANYDADGIVAGIGLKHRLTDMKLSVDYSYGSLDYNLGSVHRITIGAGF